MVSGQLRGALRTGCRVKGSRVVARTVTRLSRCFSQGEAAFSVPLTFVKASFRGTM